MDISNIEELKEWLKTTSATWEENGEGIMLRGLKLFDLEIEEVEVNGDEDSRHFAEMVENLTQGKNNTIAVTRDTPQLSEAIKSYLYFITEKGKKVRAKTVEDYRAKLEAFLEIIGDMDVSNISEANIIDYKKILENLPPNRNKKTEFIGLTARECSEKNTDKPLSNTTVRNTIIRISTFCNWCTDRKMMDFNPATAFIPEKDEAENKLRISFNDDDLDDLFGNREILNFKTKGVTSYTYWSSLIALYTGARLEEVCRLRLEDFKLDGPIPHIAITPYFDEIFKVQVKLKTINSKRLVPLHPDLKEFGLFDYVKGLEKSGFYKLFPELILARDGFGGRVSNWFRRFKERNLSNNSGKKTFHSFRHTFINRLVKNKIDNRFITDAVGHAEDKKETLSDSYIDESELIELYDAIKTLNFKIVKYAPKMRKVSEQLITYSQTYTIKNPNQLKPSIMGE